MPAMLAMATKMMAFEKKANGIWMANLRRSAWEFVDKMIDLTAGHRTQELWIYKLLTREKQQGCPVVHIPVHVWKNKQA
jgi:hypothetical protein